MKIKKSEVLRYLGHKNQEIEPELSALVDETIKYALECARPQSTYAIFDIKAVESGIAVGNTGLILTGKSMRGYMKNCSKAALMAATAGTEIDSVTRRLQNKDMTKSLIFDACGNAIVEEICDEVEEKIAAIAKTEGYKTKFRYSPGYGDLPLDIQPKFLSILDAQKRIGLFCNKNNILLPFKSVTAIIGFTKTNEDISPQKGCETCEKASECSYKKS